MLVKSEKRKKTVFHSIDELKVRQWNCKHVWNPFESEYNFDVRHNFFFDQLRRITAYLIFLIVHRPLSFSSSHSWIFLESKLEKKQFPVCVSVSITCCLVIHSELKWMKQYSLYTFCQWTYNNNIEHKHSPTAGNCTYIRIYHIYSFGFYLENWNKILLQSAFGCFVSCIRNSNNQFDIVPEFWLTTEGCSFWLCLSIKIDKWPDHT